MAQRARFVLALQDGCGKVSELCGRFGISRKTGYKWWGRFLREGLGALKDRARRPKRAARAHGARWRERLRALRMEHPRWGPKKLRWQLRRRYRAAQVPALSTLARWLKQMELIGPRPKRARRGPAVAGQGLREASGPNEVWTVDFKGWFRTANGERCEPLTVRDLYSRFVLGVALLANQSDGAVRTRMKRWFGRYGVPKVIRVDNGAPFGGKGALGLSGLSVWWLRLGIEVEFTRPAHPQDNGAHEQMHRVLKADTATPPARTRAAQQRRNERWVRYYNYERPHEGLGQQVPAQSYQPSRRRASQRLEDPAYARAWSQRRVRNRGHIKWQGRLRFIGRAFVGELVGLKPIGAGVHEIYLAQKLIGTLHPEEGAGMRPAFIQRRH